MSSASLLKEYTDKLSELQAIFSQKEKLTSELLQLQKQILSSFSDVGGQETTLETYLLCEKDFQGLGALVATLEAELSTDVVTVVNEPKGNDFAKVLYLAPVTKTSKVDEIKNRVQSLNEKYSNKFSVVYVFDKEAAGVGGNADRDLFFDREERKSETEPFVFKKKSGEAASQQVQSKEPAWKSIKVEKEGQFLSKNTIKAIQEAFLEEGKEKIIEFTTKFRTDRMAVFSDNSKYMDLVLNGASELEAINQKIYEKICSGLGISIDDFQSSFAMIMNDPEAQDLIIAFQTNLKATIQGPGKLLPKEKFVECVQCNVKCIQEITKNSKDYTAKLAYPQQLFEILEMILQDKLFEELKIEEQDIAISMQTYAMDPEIGPHMMAFQNAYMGLMTSL